MVLAALVDQSAVPVVQLKEEGRRREGRSREGDKQRRRQGRGREEGRKSGRVEGRNISIDYTRGDKTQV